MYFLKVYGFFQFNSCLFFCHKAPKNISFSKSLYWLNTCTPYVLKNWSFWIESKSRKTFLKPFHWYIFWVNSSKMPIMIIPLLYWIIPQMPTHTWIYVPEYTPPPPTEDNWHGTKYVTRKQSLSFVGKIVFILFFIYLLSKYERLVRHYSPNINSEGMTFVLVKIFIKNVWYPFVLKNFKIIEHDTSFVTEKINWTLIIHDFITWISYFTVYI